jgi:dienelactone hydrolase
MAGVRRALLAVTAVLLAGALPATALGAFADEEARNFSKTNERYQHLTLAPAFQERLTRSNATGAADSAAILAADPERSFQRNLCQARIDGCAGDVRFFEWDEEPGNIRRPALWTARSGATISGNVWATAGGPARKPGIVITNGSVQAPEQLYWAQAAALARAGYVVLTWDPQTQGQSDTSGAPPTQGENGTPQSPGAFTDGTVDALDFLLSTPAAAFRPRNSATMPAVSHAAKQDRRVGEGRNAAFNPLHDRLDPERIGIAGHSLGAFGVSKVASEDRRVDAVVAWDQLSTTERGGDGQSSGGELAPRVPALSLSGDYGIGSPGGAVGVNPRPYTAPPDPQGANGPSRAFSAAGIDTMQVNTRAGTHFESALIPNAGFAATLRGIDKTAWYTIGWFERYVKGDAAADRLLLTDRWRGDAESARVDPTGDGNIFSAYLRSRIDVGRSSGRRVRCEDLRAGCPALGPDGGGPFDVVEFAFGRQSLPGAGAGDGRRRDRRRCATRVRTPRRLSLSRSNRRLRITLRLTRRARVTAYAKPVRRPVRGIRRARTRRGGDRTVVLRLRRRAEARPNRVTIGLRCDGRRQQVVRRLRLVR